MGIVRFRAALSAHLLRRRRPDSVSGLAQKVRVGKAYSPDIETKDTMKFIWQRPRTFMIAAVAIAAAAATVAIGGRPQTVSEPLLGAEWQCSRTAFLVTTCSPSGEKIKERAGSIGASQANITRPSS